MPLYEMSFIVKNMPKARVVAAVKRIAESVLDEGGYVSKIESLGSKHLPYKMTRHGNIYTKGNYFLLNFAAPPTSIRDIVDHSKRDVDVFRPYVFKIEPPAQFQCTLHEEIQPPPYRSDVRKLIREAERKLPLTGAQRFPLNTGLKHDPF
ncbi:small ribosomal subunit protein bS6m [Panulirus ornatus]|uniref:small ribosomal subunit protein bS6m n=1 Tax=Panulirus ornatus TaxID=150431 RepID=UPI003A8A6507